MNLAGVSKIFTDKKLTVQSMWFVNKSIKFFYKIVVYALLLSVSYVFLYPLFRMISMSFMPRADIINPEVLWIPTRLAFTNFIVASFVMDIPQALLSTLGVTTIFAVAQTVVTALTGFALARFNFALKGLWFVLILISFIIPIPVILIPRVMLFLHIQETYALQMIGTVYPQLLLSMFGQGTNSSIAILIFYNFFRLIPISLDEAARIDGASTLRVFYDIIIKMSVTAITIVFLFSFVWYYNETYVTNTFIRTGVNMVTLRLGAFDDVFQALGAAIPGQAGEARINEAYRMAGTFLTMLPLLFLYLFAQKKFIEGVENTGITGE